MSNPTERFSNRVENYVKYRPGYPAEIIAYLAAQAALTPSAVVADIGSGTGILSELFLQNGNQVYGVEPNPEMRAAAEKFLGGYAKFHSIAAPAEATTLPDDSIDLIIVGQAFHWFDQKTAKVEFQRILKTIGVVVLVWNSRVKSGTAFMEAYEDLLQQYALGYKDVVETNIADTDIMDFFHPNTYTSVGFDNAQDFDFEGLRGRALSSSYAPLEGHPNYEPFTEGLQKTFEQHQIDGTVRFAYKTRLYWGRLK